jgi:hypothetical protein
MIACVHRYRIGPQQGPVSIGVCQRCGDRKSFRTSFNETLTPYARFRARKAARAALARRG